MVQINTGVGTFDERYVKKIGDTMTGMLKHLMDDVCTGAENCESQEIQLEPASASNLSGKALVSNTNAIGADTGMTLVLKATGVSLVNGTADILFDNPAVDIDAYIPPHSILTALINVRVGCIRITNSTSFDGIYMIGAVTTTTNPNDTVTVKCIDGTTPSFTAETCTADLLELTFFLSAGSGLSTAGITLATIFGYAPAAIDPLSAILGVGQGTSWAIAGISEDANAGYFINNSAGDATISLANAGGGDLIEAGDLTVQGDGTLSSDANIITTADIEGDTGTINTFDATSITVGGTLSISGIWIDMDTGSASGIGSGGVGANPWVAYSQGGSYIADSALGDIVYMNQNGNMLFSNTSYGEAILIDDNNVYIRGGLQTALTNPLTIVATSTTANCTAHGLSAGDSVRWVNNLLNNEIFTVASVTTADVFEVDSAAVTSATAVTAYKDANLFNVQSGDKKTKFYIDKSGNVVIGDGSATIDYTLTFNGETNDGLITWMEDEDYFLFSDNTLVNSTKNIYFNDTSSSINDDGTNLVLTSNGAIKATPLLSVNTSNTDTNAQLVIRGNSDFGGLALKAKDGPRIYFDTGSVDGSETQRAFMGLKTVTGRPFSVRNWAGTGTNQLYTIEQDGSRTSAGTEVFELLCDGTCSLKGNTIIGRGASGVDYTLTFDGQTYDGIFTWMEDEARLDFDSDFSILSDSKKVYFGAGVDMSIWYDGTIGHIKTSDIAASDLNVDCGTDKTLILNETVWEDVQFPVEAGKVPAANYPTYEAFTSANIEAFAFSVNDKIQLSSNEPPHGWKEGTVGSAHVHFAIKTLQNTGANRFVKLELIFAYSDYNGVWTEQAAITQEQTIPTGSAALQSFLTTFSTTVTLTSLHIGSQIKCRVKRIAATGGTEYADDVYITQVGIHVEKDTLGSRTVSTK